MDKNYFNKFADRFSSPEELVKKSFEFLLQREPKESILGEFNLSVINDYFSEYQQTMLEKFSERFHNRESDLNKK